MNALALAADGWAASAGSTIGSEHVRLGRNNQDAAAAAVHGELAIAVVCDGCSSSRAPEVGAKLAAAWLCAHLPAIVARRGGVRREVAHDAARGLLAYLYEVATGLNAGNVPAFAAEHLLFGFLCAIADRERALIFGAGDGVFSVDGAATVLDPGPENAPPYLAYALCGHGSAEPVVHLDAEAASVRTLLVATDGLAGFSGLAELERDETCARNPTWLQRRLFRERGFRDDASAALIQRRAR